MSAVVPTVIGLGRLVNFIIRDPQGQRLRLTPRGEQWLAWNPDTHDLVVLRPRNGQGQLVKRGDARRHRAFHGVAPEQTRPMEWPVPSGLVRQLGLIESVTYTAAEIHSPSKGSHYWVHQFGDRGERGHGRIRLDAASPYPERLMPQLYADSAGNLTVVRTIGSRYMVCDWIIG